MEIKPWGQTGFPKANCKLVRLQHWFMQMHMFVWGRKEDKYLWEQPWEQAERLNNSLGFSHRASQLCKVSLEMNCLLVGEVFCSILVVYIASTNMTCLSLACITCILERADAGFSWLWCNTQKWLNFRFKILTWVMDFITAGYRHTHHGV